MKKYNLIAFFFISSFVFATEYHVSVNGSDQHSGTAAKPFKTIRKATEQAYPGDTITVHAGTYREWVNPLRGGASDAQRIVYRAAPGEKVEIKGSEIVKTWKKVKNGVWKVSLPNSFFGKYNPYRDSVAGDWFYDKGRVHHTGEVFLNNNSLDEKATLAEVLNPSGSRTWYCESNAETTTIWANFQNFNPNRESTEISTRRTCIYPEKPGIHYITISGFHISQAATQWAAPTAEQVGMVATHWNKGWIIENNVISDSKCVGITLGKERGTGHNVWTADKGNVNNDGNIHYIEVIFKTLRNGWNKENIGSHTVRNNVIFNCEQAGICGSMGAAFSVIENNHIYNIWRKQQFDGAEIAGIKFHGAIDAVLNNNRVHDCGRGLWLDWMTQGTHISRNLFYNNTEREDAFIEVNHGPYIVDNNIFLSPRSLEIWSSGGAFVHNLFAGAVNARSDLSRFTPYFLPHSTEIAGFATIFGGDDRYYNNIFIGNSTEKTDNVYGLAKYNTAKLQVWISGNTYYNAAQPSDKDQHLVNNASFSPALKLTEEGGHGYLHFSTNGSVENRPLPIVTTETLGQSKIPKLPFENPDGTVLKIDTDYFGSKRMAQGNKPGPFSNLMPGKNVFKVW
ncbi:MAG: right-handed parallel beta-helix repeat-containing protein [Cytophagales bacterium]|jgi:hypothetical protein|nr:right-handed parallel beta-helix repeat-containing protein [Cytophagales bacterium]